MWQRFNDKIAHSIMTLLETEKQGDRKMAVKVQYALQVFLDESEKFLLLILFFGVFYDVKKFLLAFVALGSVRIFLGGSHRKTKMGCLLSSLVNFGLILYLAAFYTVSVPAMGGLIIFLVWEIFMWAPIASPQQLHYSSRQKKKIKKKALLALVFWGGIFSFLPSGMRNVVFWALAFQGMEVFVVMLCRSRQIKAE